MRVARVARERLDARRARRGPRRRARTGVGGARCARRACRAARARSRRARPRGWPCSRARSGRRASRRRGASGAGRGSRRPRRRGSSRRARPRRRRCSSSRRARSRSRPRGRRACGRDRRSRRRARRPRPPGRPSAWIGSRSHGWPARWTGRIAFVRGVTAAATSSGSMLRSLVADVDEDGRRARVHDHVRGRRPGDRRRDHLVARPDAERDEREVHRGGAGGDREHVLGLAGTRPSAPRAAPPAARSSASPSAASRRRPRSPPRRSPAAGSRVASPASSDEEAYCARRPASPFERVVAARAGGEHGAGAVRAVPQRPEAVTRLPVEPDLANAVDRERLLEPSVARSSPSGATRKTTQAPPARGACVESTQAFSPSAKSSASPFRSTPSASSHSSAS